MKTSDDFYSVSIEHLSRNIAHLAIISYLDCKAPLKASYEITVPAVQSCVEDLVSLASDTEAVEWSLKEFSTELVKAALMAYLDVKRPQNFSTTSHRFLTATIKIIDLFKQLSKGSFVSQVPIKGYCSMLGCLRGPTIGVNGLYFCGTDYNKLFESNAT